MTDFKTMTKKTTPMTKKKILAGATAMVALSGFVPAINAASPTANTNVGAEVVIQQAITLVAGAKVDFGTIILSAATVAGWIILNTGGGTWTGSLTGEATPVGAHAIGTMVINSSAGAVNIALGAAPTDDGGNITYSQLRFGGAALSVGATVYANSNKDVTLVGSVLSIGSRLRIIAKPTPGTYNTKSYAVTVTDI